MQATLETLAQRISVGEARDLASQLAPELAPWLNATQRSQWFDVDEFIRRLAERLQVDDETALRRARRVRRARAGGRARARRSAVDAVLEPPADRIAGGEVDDLIARLAPALHGTAEARLRARGGLARPLALERFVALIAEREGVPPARR